LGGSGTVRVPGSTSLSRPPESRMPPLVEWKACHWAFARCPQQVASLSSITASQPQGTEWIRCLRFFDPDTSPRPRGIKGTSAPRLLIHRVVSPGLYFTGCRSAGLLDTHEVCLRDRFHRSHIRRRSSVHSRRTEVLNFERCVAELWHFSPCNKNARAKEDQPGEAQPHSKKGRGSIAGEATRVSVCTRISVHGLIHSPFSGETRDTDILDDESSAEDARRLERLARVRSRSSPNHIRFRLATKSRKLAPTLGLNPELVSTVAVIPIANPYPRLLGKPNRAQKPVAMIARSAMARRSPKRTSA
jgi:hypothetical protein